MGTGSFKKMLPNVTWANITDTWKLKKLLIDSVYTNVTVMQALLPALV